jgi:phosphomannomutase
MTCLETMRSKGVDFGIVSGSDRVKIIQQLGEPIANDAEFCFGENGLTAHKKGKLIGQTSLKEHMGEENIKKFVNFCLHYIADLDIPIKRGTFVEFRHGMINVSPIGRNCANEERNDFEQYDHEHLIRKTMIEKLKAQFSDLNLRYSIGGQISFDVFPQGWDKSYCL